MERGMLLEGYDINGFVPVGYKMGKNFRIIVTALLYQIWDITVKFGRCGSNSISWKILNVKCIAVNSASRFLFVICDPADYEREMDFYRLSNGIWVLWEKKIDYLRIITVIAFMEDLADKFGLIKDGTRLAYSDPAGISFENCPKMVLEKTGS